MTNYSGGKKGFVLKTRPKRYIRTPQQQKLIDVVRECGIKKGISKTELQRLMVECVGPKMKKSKKNK